MRRLYDALGIEISSVGEISHRVALADGKLISVYLGPKPPLGVFALEGAQYGIPNRASQILQADTEYKSSCFLEVTISVKKEISVEQVNLLKQEHKETREFLMAEAEMYGEKFQHMLDAISGILGLRVHRQLVLKQLVENPFVSGDFLTFASFAGPAMEMLETIGANANTGPHILRLIEDEVVTPEDVFVRGGSILHWLVKAWRERDPISKFMYLFIPLEAILSSTGELGAESKADVEALEALVRASTAHNSETLLAFLERAKDKFSPTLTSRFEELAAQAKLPGWELDVKAFKKYNRMRNLLLHKGDKRIRGHINFEENSRTLEDLVERYVAVRLLGTTSVYPSRWRPQRPPLIVPRKDS